MRILERKIEEEMDWRQKELDEFKRMIFEAEKGSMKEQALIRAVVAMLYAHFEGFCITVWNMYLDTIEQMALVRGECREEILLLSLGKHIKQARNFNDFEFFRFCRQTVPSLLNETVSFPGRLESKSNLRPDRFRKNAKAIGLPHQEMDRHEKRIEALVARRNEIAHGKKHYFDSIEEYRSFENAVLDVMVELGVVVQASIEEQWFLAGEVSGEI